MIDRHTFTVKNTGKAKKSFKITHVPAGTALTIEEVCLSTFLRAVQYTDVVIQGTIRPSLGPVPLSATAATVKFLPKSFTVQPGRTQVVTVFIAPPEGLDAKQLPVFSGFLEIANADESYHVTYLGAAAALKDVSVVDNTDTFFGVDLPALVDGTGNFFTDPTNFTFVSSDFPQLVSRLNFGTAKVRFDLVDPSIKITTTLNKRDNEAALHVEAEEPYVFKRQLFSFPHGPKGGSFAQVKTLGALFEADYQPRNSEVDDGTGFNLLTFSTPSFANGTTIPNGSYRILLRALKVTGNPTKEEDFESWLSPIIGVQAPAA